MSYKERKAMEQGVAAKTDPAIKSYDDLRKGYFDAKNKGGKAFYDFIQQHKNQLSILFSNIPAESNLITLVPSIGEEATNTSDKKWVKEHNKELDAESSLRDAQIAAKEQSIKDVRQRYRPDLAKMEDDDAALTERIKDELKHKGYNPTDEDVRQVKQEILKEHERVRRANEWEQKPWWQRFGYEIIAPRQAESRAMGYKPTGKDVALDAIEFGSNFLPFGAIKAAPKVFNKLGKIMSKADELTQGVPGLDIVGDLAKGGGELGLAEFLPSVAIKTSDAVAYDDGRERGEAGVGGVLGGAVSDAVTAALIGHAAKKLTPEKQKVLDAADEAIKKQAKLSQRGKYKDFDISDDQLKDWVYYRNFKDLGDIKNIDATPNYKKTSIGGRERESIIENLSSIDKQEIKEYMDATGLDYIDAIDAIAKGEAKIGTPEELALMKKLQKIRDKFYYENAGKALISGAKWGSAAAALKRAGENVYDIETEDRGYEDE